MIRHIKSVLPQLMRPQEEWKFYLLNNWQEIMGNLGSIVTLEKIEGNVLFLGVPNSCWMQELHMLAPALIETINQKLDQPRINQLRFKRIATRKKENVPRAAACNKQRTKEQNHTTPQQQAALKKVRDPDLRRVLEQFLDRCHEEP